MRYSFLIRVLFAIAGFSLNRLQEHAWCYFVHSWNDWKQLVSYKKCLKCGRIW